MNASIINNNSTNSSLIIHDPSQNFDTGDLVTLLVLILCVGIYFCWLLYNGKSENYDSNASTRASLRMAARGKGALVVPNKSKNRASARMAARGKGELGDIL